jgi:hypothetical protein
MGLGTKVKAKGRSKMEYGLVVINPDPDMELGELVVLWDTTKPDDYEGYYGATFLQEADPNHVFKYIDKNGLQINRSEQSVYKPKRSVADKKKKKKNNGQRL